MGLNDDLFLINLSFFAPVLCIFWGEKMYFSTESVGITRGKNVLGILF